MRNLDKDAQTRRMTGHECGMSLDLKDAIRLTDNFDRSKKHQTVAEDDIDIDHE